MLKAESFERKESRRPSPLGGQLPEKLMAER